MQSPRGPLEEGCYFGVPHADNGIHEIPQSEGQTVSMIPIGESQHLQMPEDWKFLNLDTFGLQQQQQQLPNGMKGWGASPMGSTTSLSRQGSGKASHTAAATAGGGGSLHGSRRVSMEQSSTVTKMSSASNKQIREYNEKMSVSSLLQIAKPTNSQSARVISPASFHVDGRKVLSRFSHRLPVEKIASNTEYEVASAPTSPRKSARLKSAIGAMTTATTTTDLAHKKTAGLHFRENEERRKEKEIVRENQKVLKRDMRKQGMFLEFSKVGPARNISCLQTRIDNYFNRGDSGHETILPAVGAVISNDITKWKVLNVRPHSSGQLNSVKDSEKTASGIAKEIEMPFESETLEQKSQKAFKIRSNLDDVVHNIRGINLTKREMALRDSQVYMKNQGKMQNLINNQAVGNNRYGAKEEEEDQSPIQQENNQKGFEVIHAKNSTAFAGTQRAVSPQQDRSSKYCRKIGLFGKNVLRELSSGRLRLPKGSRKSVPAIILPRASSFQLQSGNLPSGRMEIQSSVSLAAVGDFELNSNEQLQSKVTLEVPSNGWIEYNFSQNRIRPSMSMQQFQVGSSAGIPAERDGGSTNNNRQFSSVRTLSFCSLNAAHLSNKNLAQSKKMNIDAYNQAIREIRANEKEDEKWMFDPNAERIKKKRKIRERLKMVLLLCKKMGVPVERISEVAVLSTIPYQNKGSFVFIECVKKNEIESVVQLLEKNKYFISDFDQFRLTSLHHACKKGHLDIVRLLIARGADIEAKDTQNRTPLFYALVGEQREIIKELLCAKCTPWSGDNFSFLAKNLSQETLALLKVAKRADIIIRLSKHLEDKARMWSMFKKILQRA